MDIAGLPGGPGLSTFHFDPTTNGSSAQDVADAVETFFQAWDTFVNNSLTFTGSAEVEEIDSATGQQTGTQPVIDWSVPGLDTSTMLPPITQMLVRWNTPSFFNGRRLQGKTYLPGLCEDANEPGGVPQTAIRLAVQVAAQALADDPVDLVVYSKTNFGFSNVTVASVWDKWAILSGRRDG